jgi:cytochrome b
VKVWDPFVRIAHWTLVTCVLSAWATGEIKISSIEALHEWLGYAALAVIAARLLWGFVGPRYARFAQFIVGPARTLSYARTALHGSEPRYLGHNPLGGWMIVALLTTAAAASVTGWLSITDRYWGVGWMQDTHEAVGNALIALAVLHVAGVLFTSVRHRENLVAAMWTGIKRAPAGRDIA